MGALTVAHVTLARNGALLTRYVLPLRTKVVLLAVLLLGDTALRLVNPQILSRFIDMARGGGSSAALATLAVVFLVTHCAIGLQIMFSTRLPEPRGLPGVRAFGRWLL